MADHDPGQAGTGPSASVPWYPHPIDAAASWRSVGRRAPFESVHRGGVDITDTVPPTEWPEPYRSDFFETGWRPFTPPGVRPVWWDFADGRTDPTPPAHEMRMAARRRAVRPRDAEKYPEVAVPIACCPGMCQV